MPRFIIHSCLTFTLLGCLTGAAAAQGPETRARLAERATLTELEEMLAAESPASRMRAVRRLANLAPRAIDAERVSSLLEAARSDVDLHVAAQAESALAGRGRRVASVAASRDVAEYRALLGAADPDMRLRAVSWLLNAAENGRRSAFDALIEARQGVDPRAASAAALAIEALHREPPEPGESARAAVSRQESLAEYAAVLMHGSEAERFRAVGWLANEAQSGSGEALALLQGATGDASRLVAEQAAALVAHASASAPSVVE